MPQLHLLQLRQIVTQTMPTDIVIVIEIGIIGISKLLRLQLRLERSRCQRALEVLKESRRLLLLEERSSLLLRKEGGQHGSQIQIRKSYEATISGEGGGAGLGKGLGEGEGEREEERETERRR